MGSWSIERSCRETPSSAEWLGLLEVGPAPCHSALLCLAGPVPGRRVSLGARTGRKAAASGSRPKTRVGRLVRIPMPITDKVDNHIRRVVDSVLTDAKRAGEWPVFIFEIEPGRANFGQAYDLANFLSGPALNGATTVAWIPKTITGHAVLVAMACDEIIMSPEAEIGKAGEFERVIEPSVRNAYVGIANRRMNIPATWRWRCSIRRSSW